MTKRIAAAITGFFCAWAAMVPSGALAATAQRDVFYTYDALGHQLTAKFDSATGADGITNAYNGFGELTSSTIKMGSVTKTVAGQYDADGNRTQATVDGQAFTYAFDGLDRLNNIYEGAGTSTALDQFSYNADATLHSRTEGTGSLQPSATYGYDGAERLISQSDAFPATTQSNVGWTFTRNPASELAGETRTNDSYAYSTLVNANPSYTVNGLNQYTGVGATSYCYDDNGNLTADGSSVYLYDVENRLVQKRAQTSTACPTATTGYTGALQANVAYDPLGRLFQVDKGTAGTTTVFLYDGDALVAEYNSTGATLLARYVHGSNAAADDPLVWYTYTSGIQTGKRFLHADHLGSIVAMTNGNSAPSIDRYDEYGIPGTTSTGTVTNTGRFQYTGQAYIPELGMYYYKARIYSPRLGRFLQTDPVGYEGGINIYEYAEDDPIDNVDPMGTVWCSGTVTQCGAYDRALTLAAEAAKNHALSPSQRADLNAEVQSIRNDDKYVILFRSKEFISTVESGSAAFSYTDAAKNGIVFTVLPNDFDKLFEKQKEFLPGTVPGAERAAVAMHEGSHREDFEKGLIKHGDKTEENSPTQQKAVSRQLLTSQGARATCLEADARTGLCQ